MRVLIRADASLTIGSGHITRCLTLAHVLKGRGARVVFACRQLPGQMLERLRNEGFATHALPANYPAQQREDDIEALLPWQADIDALSQTLADEVGFDWLIVDHYGLAADWEQAARRFAPRIMAIDDLANRPHEVDVLLDQNLSGTAQAYAPWLNERCQALLGPHFALLRAEFQREPVPIRPRIQRVLVNFGGFDAARQCWLAMQALAAFPALRVDFVSGVDNPDWLAMQALAEGRFNWQLHTHVSDFSRLMSEADLFVGAGGGTTWERAALGVPTICVAVAANQQANAEAMAEAGAHCYLGRREQVTVARLRQALGELIDHPQRRREYALQSRHLVDGKGAERVAAALSSRLLSERKS